MSTSTGAPESTPLARPRVASAPARPRRASVALEPREPTPLALGGRTDRREIAGVRPALSGPPAAAAPASR